MPVLESEARITAVDATGPVFDNVAAKFDKLKGSLSSGGNAVAKFGGTGVTAMNDMGNAADRVDATLGKIAGVLASGVLLHKIIALGEASATAFASLDDVRRMQAAAAGAAEAPPAFIEQQQRLGRGATRFSEADIAKAQLAVQQAGVAIDAVGSVIEGAKDFAVAMQATDLAQVAKHLVDTREALKQLGEETPAAFEALKDRMVKLHQISGMSEEAIASAYAQAGVTAAQTGLSDASLAAMMTLIARTGADPGETLRMFLTKLQAPGEKGIEALGAMGIDYGKYTTTGTLTEESFLAFMQRHGMVVTEKNAGALAKIFADPKIMGDEEKFRELVIDAAGASLRDKRGEVKPAAVKKLNKDVHDFYAEHVGKVDTEGLLEAIEAAHPTLGQIEGLFGTRRAARALPFLRDQAEFERVKAQFEQVPPGITAKAATEIEAGPGEAARKLGAAKEGILERGGQVWSPELQTIENAITTRLKNLSDQGVRTVTAVTAAVGGLAAYEVAANALRFLAPTLGQALALAPFKAAGAAAGPWGALTLPLMLSGDVPEWAPKWGEYINPSTGLPHISIEDIRGLGSERATPVSAFDERFGTWPSGPGAELKPTVAAPVTAEVKGDAELKVSIISEPSSSFISQIVSAIRNEINVFGSGSDVGTAGSTGRSMPEAGPAPQ